MEFTRREFILATAASAAVWHGWALEDAAQPRKEGANMLKRRGKGLIPMVE